MPIPDKVQRRIVRQFGNPLLFLKLYDQLDNDTLVATLSRNIIARNMQDLAFAGVGYLGTLPEMGPFADLQFYGRKRPENPEDVYPLSICLADGTDLPKELGRACLEETILFGKEAELYFRLQGMEHKKQLTQWLQRFAL